MKKLDADVSLAQFAVSRSASSVLSSLITFIMTFELVVRRESAAFSSFVRRDYVVNRSAAE